MCATERVYLNRRVELTENEGTEVENLTEKAPTTHMTSFCCVSNTGKVQNGGAFAYDYNS